MKAYLVTYKAYVSLVEYRTALVYAEDSARALTLVQNGEEEETIDYESGDSDTNEISFDDAEIVEAAESQQIRMADVLRSRGIPIKEDDGLSWPIDKTLVNL